MTFTPRALLGDEKPDPTPPAAQREQALAALNRIEEVLPPDGGAWVSADWRADLALVRAALTPPPEEERVVSDDGWNRLNLADRRRITERLLRARPTLTAEEAHNVLTWADAVDEAVGKSIPWGTHEATALAKLRILEQGWKK